MDLDETEASPYFSVQLQLLHECNLRCAHCYDASHPSMRMPATEEMKRRLDLIYAFGAAKGVVPDIHLSGGEPTVRPDLVELVDYIFNTKGGDALLFSNGTRWTEPLARDLHRAGLRFVQISLEGPQAHTDRIRGEGVFEKATATLRMLQGMGFRLTVSLTITAQNHPSLRAFVEELDPMGLHFHLREVFPIGAGARLLQISPEERRALHEWAVHYEGESSVGLEDPIHCAVDPRYAEERRGCVAGRNHFCVDVDGSVYPCRPLAYKVGHVDDLMGAWRSPEMLRIRRRDYGGQCGRCQLKANCGGCRVHAQLGGDLFGEDARCSAPEMGLVRPVPEDALAEAFPITRALLGEAWGEARTAFASGDAEPDAFLAWLAESGWGQDRWPALLELAHFESLKGMVERWSDPDLVPGLASSPEAHHRLVLAPSSRVLRYGHAVHRATAQDPIPVPGDTHLLAFRHEDGRCHLLELTEGSAALLVRGQEETLASAASGLGFQSLDPALGHLKELAGIAGFR